MSAERTPQTLNGDHTATNRGAPPAVEFTNRFRGKSPEQMLGIEKTTSLILPSILATVATGITLVALTGVPYMMAKSSPAPETAKQPEAPADANNTPTPNATQPTSATSTNTATAAKTDPTKANPVLDKLGETEVKKANPKANPLDNKADDLLKDLK